MLALQSSFDVHLSLPTFWFTTASLAVRELMWAREVRGCFVLRRGWQSLYLLLSDRILFDLQLLYLWSNDLNPLAEAALTVPPLPGLLKERGKSDSVQVHLCLDFECMFHARSHTHTGTHLSIKWCSVYIYMYCTSHTAYTCADIHTIYSIHTLHLKFGLGPCYKLQLASAEVNIFHCLSLSPSPALLQDGCLLAAHITEPYKRQLKRMCYTDSVWGERVERERKEKWEGTWVRETEREKEREEVCEGKCTAPPLLQNHDWYCVYWSLLQ